MAGANSPEPIAIVGSGCRLPGGSSSPSKLWELLKNPRDLLKKVDRFNADGFYNKDGHHHGATNVRHSYLLDEDFRLFDPGFFGIKPVEAESIDPLQRLVLETVYESLENAGLAMGDLQGSDTAFYVGIMAADYQDLLLRDIENLPTYFGTGTSRSIIANRVSYVFDWHGPSMTIDTACSSSMLALHQAVQTLRSGGSDVAVAAGGNLILGPEIYIAESKLNMLSSKGRSAMWDADVDGYGRGEGFVSVVLKRLSDAIRDGDSIDCIIRETGTNQDGRTKGITMPSAIAQTSLIRDTYAGCGLDLQNVRDRPQFFEAHGTGTKAGDPVEAEAIYNAFFEPGSTLTDQQPLYVGSIKTVVGHTEGTAGLAGILKTSLALQAGIIPPNMLFNSLNPGLTPFYGPLQIPTEAKEWPSLPPGVPRRASVNSFGFGGSNAHAILESYTPVEPSINGHGSSKPPVVTPFLFSAASEAALQRSLPALRDYLAAHPDTNLSDLAWTLRARRSTLPVKLALSASSVEELLNRIDEKLQSTEGESGALIGVRSMTGSARIFGVFTGQGAQWARMGQKLIDELPFAKDLATKMDAALQALPKTYQPAWSLVEELSRDTESSRVQEAAFSQPICTLVQVILVDLLRTAGITFSAVVGHSSGEIGAAYAAGFLSASDAVKIAYLRGFHASLAAGPSGQKGAMLAVGTSIEDAQELCDLPDFEGRLKLAASNSSSSVTLSGDSAAIAHAKIVFDDEKKFARLLKIDTAYHSHHMQPCAGPYLQSMNEVGIRVLSPDGSCAWYSSVHGGTRVKAHDSLAAEYWKDNMVNAVLFSQALTGAVKNGGVFNLALEIGPHPALKGPASQTIQELDVDIPYYGTLKRGQSDLESISDCLGSVWSFLGDSAVNFEAVQKLLPHQKPPRLLKALPTYGWDHDKPYWFESRKSRLFRSRDRPSHELLGVRCDEGSDNELRWRNFLSIQEVPWLEGHQVQSQTVFPAAGYVSMAIEAARVMVGDRGIQLLEVQDLNIGKAIVFHDEKTGVETMTTLSNVLMDAADMESKVSGIITADFTVSSHLSRDHNNLTKVASGKVKVIVGPPAQAPKLPSSSPTPPHLIDVDTERFYSALETCGYGYSGPFRALSSLQRRLNFCTGLVERPAGPSAESALLVHPALLDPAFQAVLGGYFWPGDGRLWSLFLPTSIRKVTVSPSLCQEDDVTREVQLPFNAWLVDSPVHEIQGDVAIYSQDRTDCSIQIEGLRMISFVQADPGADRPFFAETVWGVSAPDGDLAMGSERASDHEWELAVACERVAYFYWRELEKTLTPHERENCEGHHKQLLKTMTRSFEQVLAGKHPHVKKDWQHDDEKSITELVEKFSSSIDIRLQTSVGKALPAVVRGETTMLEHMLPDNMLDDFYTHGLGFSKYNSFLARMVRQLAHRYPKLNFIEIGAGTGGATSAVLDVLDSAYSSYTYTDISSGFFERAAARFAGEGDKLVFKMLDVEKPPASQGYQSNTYDVVIASNVLHATANLQNTLKNVRSLLKPGGYLFLLEITNTEPIRLGFTMGGLSGWWLGADDGRPYSPCISASNWNRVLRKSGFSGVDTVTPGKDQLPHPFSILASQAVDDRVEQLRRPLLKAAAQDEWSTLCVLGGQELETSNLVEEVIGLVGHRFDEVIAIESIDTDDIDLPLHATVVSFLDLDYHVLQNMSPLKLKSLQTVFSNAKNLLWVTQGAQNDNPYANATLGLLRSVAAEIPTLQCQLLDFDAGEKPHLHPQICADALLRLRLTGSWERDSASKTQLLWSTEPELLFRDGKLWVPRILPQNEKNDRLNGQRREIKHEAKPDSLIELSRKEGSWSLRERYEPLSLPSDAPDDSVVVKAKFSTLAAPKLHDGSFVFAIGQLDDTDQWVIATTIDRSSTLRVKRARVALLEEAPNDPAALLATVLAEALSDRIAALATKSELLIVLEPHALLASILLQKSEAGGFKVKFVTQDHTRSGSEWIRLSPWQSTRTIKEVLPKNISTFVDLTSPGQHGLSSLIVAALPPSSNIEHLSSIIQECPVGPVPFSGHGSEVTNQDLVQLVARASSRSSAADDSTKVRHISLAELPQLTQLCEPLTLIDWQVDDSLSLEVAQIRPEMVFKSDKTYLLVGLTGEIGRSLCQWMVHCGAGAVVLASRNPRIDQAWVDELECLGSIIKVLPLDATRRESIVELHAVLKRDLPPVAGIANGSMVLHDQFFVDMDTETLNKVLRPKVDASVYLDEVFNDTPLDFFIMFSSLASVVGNRGQSNYAAANTFMASLARQRRLRDQPGSVMSIGRMVGLGYLERVSDVVELQLIKYGFMPISEVDLHHLFAQAIMAGLPCSGEDPDIITALRPTREDEELQVPWYNNPRFSHMILPAEKKDVVTAGKKAVLSTRAQLEATTTIEDACKVLRDCFSSKLRVILQMAASSFRPEAALIELGVDSLVAVEIRSWFLKEVGVDMAVLKILGGASTVDLCQHAIDQASKDLLPNLGGVTQKEEKEPTKQIRKDMMNGDSSDQGTLTNLKASQPQTASTSTPDSLSQSSPPITRGGETPISSVASDDVKTTPDEIDPPPHVLFRVKISSAQSRFWFLNLYMEDPTTSNVTFFYEMRGRVRIPELSRAVKAVGKAHEGLRTCFFADEHSVESAWQGVMQTSKLELEYRKISNKDEITSEYARVRDTVYDLTQGKTMRIVVLSMDNETHAIIFGYHHIIMDGVGFQIFLRDLEHAYAGQAVRTPAMQYPSFAEKQRHAIEEGSLEKSLLFWRQELKDAQLLPVLSVAKVPSRQVLNKYQSCHVQHRLATSLIDKIKATCRGSAVTPSHFYLATFRVFLTRLAGVKNVCIGMADANRRDVESMSTVGLFLNLLPLLFEATGSTSFQAVMKETRNKVYEALGHSDVPLDEILNALRLPRSSSHSPLFQAFFDYRQGAKESLNFGDLELDVGDADLGEMAYDMVLDVTEGSKGSLVVLRGQDYLYGPKEMQRLLDSYLSLLENFANNPQISSDEARLFGEPQVKDALEAGRGATMHYEWPPTTGHRIEDICKQNADFIAVKDGQGTSLTYRDLEARSHAIRERLVAEGVKPGDRVAVFQKPSAEWICCILAILWTGAVYVPLDSRNPLPRLAAIIQAARPSAILAHGLTVELASQLQTESCKIIDTSSLATVSPSEAWSIPASAEDPAIILFTSGSTGTPKGLVLRHRSLASHLESYIKAYDVGREVFLQQSAFSFDLSLAQIFTALTTGGSLVVVPEDKRGDSTEIVNLICEECITWTFATPSEYASWLEFGKQQLQLNSSWSSALSGGERLTPKLVRLFNQLDHEKVRLYNTYGPAETIISATMSEVLYRGDSWNDDRPVPVGAPLPNYSIYILDEQLNALPQGFHGEVVIGGPSPVIGYLNNDELTHEHFLLDCFADSDSKAKGWTVMYRTGDMGRLGADGTLLFEGRRGGDTQVKLRGIRVDLADIQATLINTSDGIVSDAVVSVRTEEQIVVAHVVFAHDRRPEDATSYLKGLTAVLPLPSYMRPALTIPIDKIPLNIHGKKDLLAVAKLALPQLLSSHHTDTAMTTLQRRLAELWREILPKEFAGLLNIEEDTDFFEVGGNSLLLVRLQARLRDTFQVALPLKDLFDSSSLRDMAARVEKSQIHTTIDWDTETQLTPSVISAAGSHARQAIGRVGNQTVLLTGATGYLGSYILRRLLNDSSIGKVHCVAIRGQSQDNVSDRLPLSNNKVVVHEGDLTRSRIGLSEADARRLSEDVDIMIHCGARRSFWDSYYQLKAVNFDSTKELVSLAAPRRIPIHFLSSSGVLLLAGTPSPDSNLSVASFNPPTDGSEGYVASKWASEAYLEKAADQLGIPVTIHRFTPDTKAADLELGHQALEDLLNCCIKLDSLPDQASWEGRFDLIQSEGLANRIGTAALEDAAAGLQGKKSRTNFVHHQSEVSLRATDVFGFLEKEAGSRIRQRMPALEWVGEIKKIGFGYLFASHDVSLKSTGPDGTELVNRR